jgi:hypothetical protein
MCRDNCCQNKYYAHKELRSIDDTYVFDTASGLYKPKSNESEDQRHNEPTQIVYESPIQVRTGHDWISIVISVLTLVIIAIYTNETAGILEASQVGAVGTIQASFATRDAADTARHVADDATKSFHISERPYVTVANIEFDGSLEANKEIVLKVKCDNSGRSPALKVTYVTNLFMDGKRIVDPIAHEGASVIAYGHPTEKRFLSTFTDADVEHMKNSKDAFKIKGDIQYTDIFGEWHPTIYCATYDGKEKIFKFCPSGNDVR